MKLVLLLFLAVLSNAQIVNVWLTTDDQKTLMQPQSTLTFTPAGSIAGPAVYVDEGARFQTVEGFGASMTDSSAALMNQLIPQAALPRVMESLFDHAKGIGISFLRNPMGASDIARFDYSYDDQPAGNTDPNLTNFSVAHDQLDIIPLLKQALAINPRIKMMGTPWSPPGWMKTSGSMIGGSLQQSYYTAFAGYLVKYVQAYAAAGVPVSYLSIQNEPLYVPPDYPGESMPANDQLNILKNYVIPAFAANNLSTKVLVYDHNWDTPSYPETVLGDPAVANAPQIGGIAWHWYGGPPGSMTTLHNLFPAQNQYVTEASGGTFEGDEVKVDFEMITQSMRNWSRSFVKWPLALDQNRGPHTGGCGTCSGLITVDNSTGAVTNNIDYYTLGHFSKFVMPGATRIWSSNVPGIVTAAFANPDQSTVLVAYNDSTVSRTFPVVWGGRSATLTLPALAGATLTWIGNPGEVCRDAEPARDAARRLSARCWQYDLKATQQIQASSYNDIFALQTEPTTDTDGGYDLGYAANGHWAKYSRVDFGSGVNSVNVRVASGGSGGTLQFRLDSATGPIIAQATVQNTGGWQNWTTVTAPVSKVKGVHDLYLVCSYTGSDTSGIGNLNWFQFQ